MKRKRIQIDPKNDAEKFKKSFMTENPHTTIEYGTPISALLHDDKNGAQASRPESGTFDTGKLAQTREPGPLDRGDYHQDELSSGVTEHPEKTSRTPLAADAKKERREETSRPESHVYQNPIKLKTSQELGVNYGDRSPIPEIKVDITSAKKQIEAQVGVDGSPKHRAANSWGVPDSDFKSKK